MFGEQYSDPASSLFALVSGGNQVPSSPSSALGYAVGYVSPSRTFGVLSAGLGGTGVAACCLYKPNARIVVFNGEHTSSAPAAASTRVFACVHVHV